MRRRTSGPILGGRAIVKVKTTDIDTTTPIQLQEFTVEIDDETYEHEFDFDENPEFVAVMVEILSGHLDAPPTDFLGENVSKYDSVKLYLGRLADGARHFAVRLKSKGKSLVRLTIASFKKKVEDLPKYLPCKLCKRVCRFAVCAILASFGVPYLGVGVLPLHLGVSGGSGVACKHFLMNSFATMANHGQLGVLLDRLGPHFLLAIRDAFVFVDWVFDATDSLYTKACQFLGCCPTPAAPA
jgi:hypothetical protein